MYPRRRPSSRSDAPRRSSAWGSWTRCPTRRWSRSRRSRRASSPGRPGDPTWSPTPEYRRLFPQTGCASCHVRSLTTGASPVAALQFQTFQPYSDFLLHDMGSLGDGIEQGQATGGEMRTAPLWGLRLFTAFLHDGRAGTIEEAILAHDGQGRAARDRFAALPAEERVTLVAFLRTL